MCADEPSNDPDDMMRGVRRKGTMPDDSVKVFKTLGECVEALGPNITSESCQRTLATICALFAERAFQAERIKRLEDERTALRSRAALDLLSERNINRAAKAEAAMANDPDLEGHVE